MTDHLADGGFSGGTDRYCLLGSPFICAGMVTTDLEKSRGRQRTPSIRGICLVPGLDPIQPTISNKCSHYSLSGLPGPGNEGPVISSRCRCRTCAKAGNPNDHRISNRKKAIMAFEAAQKTPALPRKEDATQNGPVQSNFASGSTEGRGQESFEMPSTNTKINIGIDQRNGLLQDATLPATPREEAASVAVDAVALITTECITVTSAMRKHARWAHSSVSAILGSSPLPSKSRETIKPFKTKQKLVHAETSSMGIGSASSDFLLGSRWGLRGKKGKSLQDDPLIAAFARLRNDLRRCTGIWKTSDGYYVGADWA